MDQKLNKFQQYIQQNPIIVGIFIIFQIIFIVLLIFVFKNINTGTFEISNLSVTNLTKDIKDLPSGSAESIQRVLYDTIALNGGTLTSIENSDAQIRDNTLVELYFDKQNMHYVMFVVDIPSLQQSYQIFHEWTDQASNPYYMTNRGTMVMCPLENDIIYSDFKCHDDFNHLGQNIVTSEFIQYFNPRFNYFSAYLNLDNPSVIIINPSVTYDNDAATKSRCIEEVKATINSLGISPDYYEYYVRTATDVNYHIPPENR